MNGLERGIGARKIRPVKKADASSLRSGAFLVGNRGLV